MFLAQRIIDDLNLSMPRWARLRYAYLPLIAFGIASSILGLAQAFGWHPVPEWNPDHPAGLLFNATVQGAFLALCIMAVLTHFSWWLIFLLTPGLYLADSRGAFLAVGFGIFADFIRKPILLLILVLAGAVYLSYHPSSSDLQRLRIWHAALTHLTFWGNGFGSFWHLWIGNPAWWPQYVHNDYLQTVFELGVWSVVPFGVVGWAASRTSAIDWPILITFLFIACFSMPLHMPLVAALGAIALITTLGAKDA